MSGAKSGKRASSKAPAVSFVIPSLRDYQGIADTLRDALSDTNARVTSVTDEMNAANAELSELLLTKECLERALHTNEPKSVGSAANNRR